jgi:hypothetical protein
MCKLLGGDALPQLVVPRRNEMIRWIFVFLVSLMFLSSARATLGRKERPDIYKHIVLPRLSASVVAVNDDFRITATTEVLLDGRPCRYERIPQGASIIFLETTTNLSKEIVKIHFRTSRSSSSSSNPK